MAHQRVFVRNRGGGAIRRFDLDDRGASITAQVCFLSKSSHWHAIGIHQHLVLAEMRTETREV